ncbi:MAG TPA: FG-GAP-like repeat-containing protein [Planctomycetaceae bacterium]
MSRGRYARAEQLARKILSQTPRDGWALIVAAEAAVNLQHPEQALEYYLQVPDDGSPAWISGQFGAGEVLCHQGRLSAAEQKLRSALERDPHYQLAHYRLAFILGITGRRWEAVPHRLELVRHGSFTADTLLLLGDVERVVNDEQLLQSCRETAPNDPLPRLGQACVAFANNHLREARKLLDSVVAVIPQEIEAQVRLGMLFLNSGRVDDFVEWHSRLAPQVDDHPGAWIVYGRWALENNEPRVAARCFWEAVLRDPENRLANYRLGQTLQELHEPERSAPFLRRAELVLQLATVLDGLYYNNHDTIAMQKASQLTESLGRLWEAWGWARLALAEDPAPDWALGATARLEPLLHPELPQTLLDHIPARDIDLSSYPLPDWKTHRAGSGPIAPLPPTAQGPRVRFADVAEEAGIRFVYENSADPTTPGARIFETTGGGVAALDFDGDGWPDLYFTQGGHWPRDQDPSEHRDRLFRNLGDGRAADVTLLAGLGDENYSQGTSAGDCDNDGFPDLYVANIGPNRLYRNNGDGTFTDATAAAGLFGDFWTTSCLIADLNGDSWPDIYDVNYCAGSQVFSLLCQNESTSRSCSPRAFHAAPDKVFLGRGDGTFEDVSESSGIDVPNGYGLGIVAADFEGAGRLNLFIANDQTANFYFVNETDRRGGPLKFAERALVSGLAFDADGMAQASMGVAAADADGNGLVDLYVSDFYNESDTLYLQQPGGLFVDATRSAGLYDPSFAPLGFGTQFLDGELDGRPDIVLTNGHIDDLRAIGQPYAMSPQYFRNLGDGRFAEIEASSLGTFFEGKYLGRGLARLDWDRDGKEDFAVSHIGSAAALAVNRTAGAGHFLALRFRGVTCDRDAIGTTVQITAAGRTRMAQLTAGDGYHASNERRLVFGLGSATTVEKLHVRWLSGIEQTFEDVSADADLLLIEGRNNLIGPVTKEWTER